MRGVGKRGHPEPTSSSKEARRDETRRDDALRILLKKIVCDTLIENKSNLAQVAVSLLNDSWQMVALTNNSRGFVALPPARAMLHDLVSMAICLGGLVLVIFTGTSSLTNDTDYNLQFNLDYSPYGKRYSLRSMMATAQWFLIAVV